MMFKQTAEKFYLRNIKIPANLAKTKYLKKFSQRHDYDMVKVSRMTECNHIRAMATNAFVNCLRGNIEIKKSICNHSSYKIERE